jgi:hypothetical protein
MHGASTYRRVVRICPIYSAPKRVPLSVKYPALEGQEKKKGVKIRNITELINGRMAQEAIFITGILKTVRAL